MTRRLLLSLFFAGLTAITQAAHSPPPDPEDEGARFRRNLALLEALVQSSVKQVQAVEPLPQAEACAEAARPFLTEIQAAAEQGDAARVAELGRHLQDLLERGVAANLRAARRQIPNGSAEEPRLLRAFRDAVSVCESFSASLRELPADDDAAEIRTALEEILRKQPGLEKMLRGAAAAAIE